jgi:hypothetical protein
VFFFTSVYILNTHKKNPTVMEIVKLLIEGRNRGLDLAAVKKELGAH